MVKKLDRDDEMHLHFQKRANKAVLRACVKSSEAMSVPILSKILCVI